MGAGGRDRGRKGQGEGGRGAEVSLVFEVMEERGAAL